MPNKPIAIIYGVGRSPGLGHSLAKLFAATHSVAILSRSLAKLEPIAAELRATTGADVRAFEAAADPDGIARAFAAIREAYGPDIEVSLGIWNAATRPAPKSFLDVTDDELAESALVNVRAPAAFARAIVPLFLANPLAAGSRPKARGALLFTGATASTKGSAGFGAFASGKFGLKAIAQSLAREFGKDGVHVGHVIVDGSVAPSWFLHLCGIRLTSSRARPQSDRPRAREDQDDGASLALSWWPLHLISADDSLVPLPRSRSTRTRSPSRTASWPSRTARRSRSSSTSGRARRSSDRPSSARAAGFPPSLPEASASCHALCLSQRGLVR